MLTLKRSSLTAFFVVLTLTIGLASTNMPTQSKPVNEALALDSELKNKLDKICPSNVESDVVEGNILGLVKSCLPIKNPLPHPNEETATLVVTTILRANCSIILTCPLPDGIVIITNTKQPELKSVLVPTTGVREGIVRYTFENIPVGFQYEISGRGGATIFFAFQLLNLQGDCVGEDTCKSTIKPGINRVTANLHYSSRV